jgi:hypothetical protein
MNGQAASDHAGLCEATGGSVRDGGGGGAAARIVIVEFVAFSL